MSASLCIHVSNASVSNIQEIQFFTAESWNVDSEKELLAKLQEVLASVRTVGMTFEVKINMEVMDVQFAIFQINKKNSAQLNINNVKLTIREIEILGLIMQGLTNHEIADKLFISFETVRSHRKNILEKTGAKNTASLINYYHQTFFEK